MTEKVKYQTVNTYKSIYKNIKRIEISVNNSKSLDSNFIKTTNYLELMF